MRVVRVVVVVRSARGGDPLGQCFCQQGLHDELPLSRDATRDLAATSRSFCPAAGTKYRSLKKINQAMSLLSFGFMHPTKECVRACACMYVRDDVEPDQLTSPTRPECLSNRPPL